MNKMVNVLMWIITMMTLVMMPVESIFASTDVTHTIKVGETVRLEISSSGRSILNRSTGKYAKWDVNSLYLEVVSSSWDYAIVRGKKATALAVVQLTVTHDHNGIYGDKYYDAFHVKVVSGENGTSGNGTSGNGTSGNGPTGLQISSTALTLNVGDTYTVKATQQGAIGGCYFTSGDKSIASVTSGTLESPMSYTTVATVTALKPGSTYIYAKTMNGLSASCKVTVQSKAVTSVSLASSLNLEEGESRTLYPTVYPSDALASYTWSTDNSGVATVSQSGVVTAKSAGTANIAVKTDNGKTATCKVTVKAAAVTEYEVNFSIYGYEHGQVLYNGKKLAGDVLSNHGSFKVSEGSDVALTVLPNDGYKIDWLWVDWDDVNDQLVDDVLTIRNIRKNTDLVVSFEEDEQPVVMAPVYLHCNVGEGGYITSGNSTIMGENKIGVNEGDDITIKIVANEGYHIDAVKLDGADVKSRLMGNCLTISDMTSDEDLMVSFEADKQAPDAPVVTTENAMTLGNVTANLGTTVTFPIGLNNVDEMTALQMDLHLPTGITLATDEEGDVQIETSNRISNKHTVDCSKMADGSYRIICYSTKNNTFTGHSGELFSLSLIVGSELTDGGYEITATNIEMSDKTGTAYSGQDVKGVVTVKSYMPGDVDDNGQHSINDVVCIINYVLNRPNTTFIEAAADLDGNGEISVNDAVLLISKYILGTSSNTRKAIRATVVNNEENYMHIEDVAMQPGEVKTIEMVMINERDDIRGMQCDITLPEGVSFLYNEDIEDYVAASSRIPKKLTLSSEMQDENTLRVAGVCTGSSSIYGNSGSVFTFKVKADENIKAGIYEIQLTNVELSYGEAIDVADRSSALEILNDANGIAALTTDGCSKSVTYDLSGRRIDISKAKKGIFIVNGKKVLIK